MNRETIPGYHHSLPHSAGCGSIVASGTRRSNFTCLPTQVKTHVQKNLGLAWPAWSAWSTWMLLAPAPAPPAAPFSSQSAGYQDLERLHSRKGISGAPGVISPSPPGPQPPLSPCKRMQVLSPKIIVAITELQQDWTLHCEAALHMANYVPNIKKSWRDKNICFRNTGWGIWPERD